MSNGPGKNQMTVEVLEDGTIKVTTGDMSGVDHKRADDFLKMMATLAGGTVKVDKAKHGKHHHHAHGHDHDHEHA